MFDLEYDRSIAPLDPALAKIADAVAAFPSMFDTPLESRHQLEANAADLARVATPILIQSAEDHLAISGDRSVSMRLYTPYEPSGVTALFFHGGGFTVGSVTHADRLARKLCRDTGAVIISVDYRLAPENPFPAANDDALTAALWARDYLSDRGEDPDRLVMMGESAGANLAACTAIAFRNLGLKLGAQVLIVPGLDFARDLQKIESAGRVYPMLNVADIAAISRLYLQDDERLATSCPPSPLRAHDVSGLAPALIAIAGHCPLEGEGLAYARRLADAGVDGAIIRLADMFHPFPAFFDHSEGALRANDRLCEAIRHHLAWRG